MLLLCGPGAVGECVVLVVIALPPTAAPPVPVVGGAAFVAAPGRPPAAVTPCVGPLGSVCCETARGKGARSLTASSWNLMTMAGLISAPPSSDASLGRFCELEFLLSVPEPLPPRSESSSSSSQLLPICNSKNNDVNDQRVVGYKKRGTHLTTVLDYDLRKVLRIRFV